MARIPRLPKSQGRSGFSMAELAKTRKNNEAYAADLTMALRGFGRRALASYAASVLDAAIRTTYHDSSRFAANWRLSFNRDSYSKDWSPKEYADQTEGGAEVGTRGSSGRFRESILASKRLYYGYTAEGGAVTVNPTGLLGARIGLTGQVGRPIGGGQGPQLGAIPRVELFNAIIDGSAKGVNYTSNALGQGSILSDIARAADASLGVTMIQAMLNQELAKARR